MYDHLSYFKAPIDGTWTYIFLYIICAVSRGIQYSPAVRGVNRQLLAVDLDIAFGSLGFSHFLVQARALLRAHLGPFKRWAQALGPGPGPWRAPPWALKVPTAMLHPCL